VRGLGTALGALLTTSAAVTLLGIAIPLVTGGRLEGVMLAVVPLAAIASFEAVQPLTQSLQLLDSTGAASTRLFELTDAAPAVIDPATPAALPMAHGIRISGLAFRYAPDLPDAVRGLELSIPAGGSLGLLGASGSGKSTLVELLLRFREYHTGSIRIGGREIAACAQDEVRSLFAVVPQRIHLFDATVRDNLAVGRADASDRDMEAACRIARIHDVIAALPEAYATRIGEDGARLSGGERQRLAIARAILRDAPIVILDEATANLDAVTEADVMDGLMAWGRGRTMLLITHREEVAARADRVLTISPPL
jgi:ATP-binding cassette subfamily C protein CydC